MISLSALGVYSRCALSTCDLMCALNVIVLHALNVRSQCRFPATLSQCSFPCTEKGWT